MRRVFIIFLSISLLLSLSACGGKSFSDDPDAMDTVSKSVVKIIVYDKDDTAIASGSGFFAFDSKTVVTNYHVVENAYRIDIVDNEDNTIPVLLIYNIDKVKDIAILEIDDSVVSHLPLKISKSKDLKKGENVVAIGSPLGLKNTISKGTISNFIAEDNVEMIQFTASISHGSSGGVLLNDSGEVIGITSGSYVDGQNLNVAIPAIEIVDLYEDKPLLKSVSNYYNETVIPTINAGVLAVGVSADFPPYEYIDNSGEFAGAEVEMLIAIANELGLKVQFSNIPFEELFFAMIDGQVDCIMGGMEYTSYRQQIANVSNSMFTDQDQFNSVIYIEKSNIDLQMAINNAIYKFQKDGSFDSILKKYGIK